MTKSDSLPRNAAGRYAKRVEPDAATDTASETASDEQPGHVAVRVLPLGDGKIADGSFGPSPDRFGHYRRGDEPRLPRGIAQQLEDKGWVEITPSVS